MCDPARERDLKRAALARALSFANPVLHMVNAFRFGFLGTSDVHVGAAFTVMTLACAALYAIAITLMNRGTGLRD